MKKWFSFLVICFLVCLIFIYAVPAHAATDNVSIVSWPSSSIDGTQLTAITDSIDSYTVELGHLADASDLIFQVILLLGVVTLTAWRREFMMYLIGTLIVFYVAFAWFDSYTLVSIALIALALYYLSTAVLNGLGHTWEDVLSFRRKG